MTPTPASKQFCEALKELWLEQTGAPLPLETDAALVLHSFGQTEKPDPANPYGPRLLVSELVFYEQETIIDAKAKDADARNSVDPTGATPSRLQYNGDVHAARPPLLESGVREILPGEENAE